MNGCSSGVPESNLSDTNGEDLSDTNGFVLITQKEWSEVSVRRVLHTFAYGGLATDRQIEIWADMSPEMAIKEMLIVAPFNEKLSPSEDAARSTTGELADLQALWSSDAVDNTVRADRRDSYSPLVPDFSGNLTASLANLQNTWVQAATTRGLNPFRHKVGLFLTNYIMAAPNGDARSFLLRNYYDDLLLSLEQSDEFSEVQALAAKSGTLALHYGHYQNVYFNTVDEFFGNDDFAREFHQLVFGIQGDLEDEEYHENVTIEHTAWMLTGMVLDRELNLHGSQTIIDWWLADIDFIDHYNFGNLNNFSNHYDGCLEILHESICGSTASEKISNLAKVASNHPESLANLPIIIINHFGDDNLDANKIDVIQEEWRSMDKRNLLDFIRAYAVSKIFHSADRVKYRTAFDRNLLIQNLTTLDNEGYFALGNTPRQQMRTEGAEIFKPTHGVFGGQTGSEASRNSSIFREAYKRNVTRSFDLGATKKLGYIDSQGDPVDWYKDWAEVIPSDSLSKYDISAVGLWLWTRIIGDGGKNYDELARAHIESLLSTGLDLNTATNNDITPLTLGSAVQQNREEANRRVGLAVNFITMMPYMFAEEGR